jgi:F-type H+-transporting ATPase subunit epsilon
MFNLTLVTPEKKLLMSESVIELTVPALKGELNILMGHAPLMTTLEAGVLRFKPANGESKSYAISWGYCQVSATGVNVLAEFAMDSEDIDSDAVKAELKDLENQLLTETLDDEAFEKVLSEQAKAKAALEVVSLKK